METEARRETPTHRWNCKGEKMGPLAAGASLKTSDA